MILIAILLWTLYFNTYICNSKQVSNQVFGISLSFLFSVAFISILFSFSLFLYISFGLFQTIVIVTPLLLIFYRLVVQKVNIFNFKNLKVLPNSLLIIIFSCFILFTWLFFNSSNRWGNWDAWSIWTLHAKFLIYEKEFVNLFSDQIRFTHPDYPLMLSSIIAVVWKSLGNQSPIVPVLVSYFTCILLLLVFVSSFIQKNQRTIAVVGLIILSCTNLLYTFGSAQYSDTLLSLFILLPIILYHHLSEEKNIALLFLTGFFAASAGWIKNEGLVFFLLFSIFFGLFNFNRKERIIYYGLGSIYPLLVIIVFKLFFAPSNDLVSGQGEGTFDKLLNPERYFITIEYFTTKLLTDSSLVLILTGISIVKFKYVKSFPFLVLFSLLISYFFVYILTPNDLLWHLSTSFDRLIHQVTPALIYSSLAAMSIKSTGTEVSSILEDSLKLNDKFS